ncbi:helix-turn-helix domain-containing protein [Paenibacillaceae bacterium]|nr:helix-turn-helix domain-containing protein [Paenibacillaceae bacterium]
MSNTNSGRTEGRPFRRSVFIKLLLSFMVILLIPVSIGTGLYNNMEHALIDHANQSNQALLEQARLSIDSRINEVDQLAVQVALNPTLQLLLYGEAGKKTFDEYKYIELIRDFKRYRNVSPIIDEYYVYLKDTGQILTTSIKTDTSMFYNYIHEYVNRDEAQMLDIMGEYHLRTYLPAEPVQYSLKKRNMITYIKSLPIGEMIDVKGSLVVMIDEEKILSLLRKTDHRNPDFYILNEEMDVLSTTAQDSTFIEGILPKLTLEQGDFEADIEGQDMMISYMQSGLNHWTYISVLPKEVVLSKVNETKSLALLLVLICFAAGLAVSYYLAYKNHRPVRELIQAILKGKNISNLDFKNEFAFIKNELITSIDEEKNIRSLLSQQAPVIKSDFIARMIKGYVDTRALTSRDLDFMDVHFNYDQFGVMVIRIDDCFQFIEEDTEREWTLIRFIIINLSNELLAGRGYAIEMERDRLAILLNQPSSTGQGSPDIEMFLQQLRSHIQQKFRTKITIAISSMKYGLDAIAEAYREAVMALDYALLQGENSIIYYNNLKNAEYHYFYYALETESQLMNYAKSGDYNSIVKTLDHIFEVNFQTRVISPEMGKYLFFELINTVLKLFHSLKIDEKQFFEMEGDPLKYIARIGTAEMMHEKLKRLYAVICKAVEGEKVSHSDRLYQKIQAYINDCYTSNDLSLTSIAEYCGLHPSYLSTFFKKQNGQNLTEYIAGLRIKLAKAYLEEGELTISQIALRVGFANDIGLIRVFKKTEGITPGKYREVFNSSSAQKARRS